MKLKNDPDGEVKTEPNVVIEDSDIQVKLENPDGGQNNIIAYEDNDDPDFVVDDEDYEPPSAKKSKKVKLSPKKQSSPLKVQRPKKVKEEEGPDNKWYQCYKCGEMVFSMLEIRKHLKDLHGFNKSTVNINFGPPREFQCSQCKSLFESEEKMQWHNCRFYNKPREPGKDYFECDLCGERFLKQEQYGDHYLFHMQERKFPCDMCDYKGKDNLALTLHKKRVHEKNCSHVCDLCGKSFMNGFELKIHTKRIHFRDKKDFICEQCGQAFTESLSLSVHRRKEHPSFRLCTFCGKVFTGVREMKKHLVFEHQVKSSNKLVPICPECKDECANLVTFDDHMVMCHNMKRDFSCIKCDLAFTTKTILKIHMIEVHNLNPLKCSPEEAELFDTVTVQTSHLMSRAKSPTSARKPKGQFSCDQCHKVFREQRILVCHRKQIHETSLHQYKCDRCSWSTYAPNLLNKHVRERHEKPRDFPCEHCSFATFSQSRLNSHIRQIHDKVRRHKCPTCEKPFSLLSHVANHMLKEHNIVLQTK